MQSEVTSFSLYNYLSSTESLCCAWSVLTPLRDQPSGERRENEEVFFCSFDLMERHNEREKGTKEEDTGEGSRNKRWKEVKRGKNWLIQLQLAKYFSSNIRRINNKKHFPFCTLYASMEVYYFFQHFVIQVLIQYKLISLLFIIQQWQ